MSMLRRIVRQKGGTVHSAKCAWISWLLLFVQKDAMAEIGIEIEGVLYQERLEHTAQWLLCERLASKT